MSDMQNAVLIGENDYGYQFGAGQLAGEWRGFAVGGGSMIYFLPHWKEGESFETCVRRAGAMAQSPEYGYGGIERWFVEESLRGRPEDFICPECGSVGCFAENHELGFAFDDCAEAVSDNGDGNHLFVIDEAAPVEDGLFEKLEALTGTEPRALGPCCACGGDAAATKNIRNFIMLDLKLPPEYSGTGWGCVKCGASSDGAVAVICDGCLDINAEIKFYCAGFASTGERRPVGELTEKHEHDLRRHPEETARRQRAALN